MNMDSKTRENFIIHVMNNGFSRAAHSFSSLVARPIRITNSSSVLIRHDNDFSCFSEEKGDLVVLTTQIIGTISGKSFLIFSEDESKEIFRTLKNSNQSMQEAFLLEIDNIISASVIAELSNSLGIEVYGDVPQLLRIHSRDLQGFMNGEIKRDDPSSMILSNTTFHFEKERVHPQFIWKLSSKVFDIIPEEKLVA
jgi:chemotaxis protein CheY-P-specific phosphatase CheC